MTFYNAKIKEWGSFQKSAALHYMSDEQIAVIRKELVVLTGDPYKAVVLNQLLYWILRIKDFDFFIAEEEERAFSPDHTSFSYGGFSKSAQELLEETMLSTTLSALRHDLSSLVEKGWVQTRIDPKNKEGKTTQYRVNLRKLCIDLQSHGYNLPDFTIYETLSPSNQSQLEEKI